MRKTWARRYPFDANPPLLRNGIGPHIRYATGADWHQFISHRAFLGQGLVLATVPIDDETSPVFRCALVPEAARRWLPASCSLRNGFSVNANPRLRRNEARESSTGFPKPKSGIYR